MGLNTAMMVLNDHLHEIENDPLFGKKVHDAICGAWGREPYTHGFNVLQSHHADGLNIVAVGGNTIRSLGWSSYSADDETILRDLARKHGYRLVKKAKDAAQTGTT